VAEQHLKIAVKNYNSELEKHIGDLNIASRNNLKQDQTARGHVKAIYTKNDIGFDEANFHKTKSNSAWGKIVTGDKSAAIQKLQKLNDERHFAALRVKILTKEADIKELEAEIEQKRKEQSGIDVKPDQTALVELYKKLNVYHQRESNQKLRNAELEAVGEYRGGNHKDRLGKKEYDAGRDYLWRNVLDKSDSLRKLDRQLDHPDQSFPGDIKVSS
jgi:hypothetical protein